MLLSYHFARKHCTKTKVYCVFLLVVCLCVLALPVRADAYVGDSYTSLCSMYL
jgi:hypothetical protein